MGGFALALLSSHRKTRDVDVAFQAPNKMRSLWSVVENEPRLHWNHFVGDYSLTSSTRLKIPNTRLIANVMKVFAKTGPGFDDCKDRIDVEVDLIENGSLGAPSDLTQHQRTVVLGTSSGQTAVKTLDILYLLKSKLKAFADRGAIRDQSDIQHLLQNYSEEVRGATSQLDPGNVQIFLSGLPSASQQRWMEFFSLS